MLMPIIYLPHGGGPLPVLGDPGHRDIVNFLQTVPNELPQPRAILMISAHWEHDIAAISSAEQPAMIYDYYGFPPESYTLQYPAPGEPELAQTVAALLADAGISYALDPERGYDHGTFIPLMLMYPEAKIPVVQVSLLNHLDPVQHLELGKALAPLRAQGVMIIGSGLSFHAQGSVEDSEAFDQWLTQTLVEGTPDSAYEGLKNWEQAPSARACHRREEHLLPVHVCLGAAYASGQNAQHAFSGSFYGKKISGFVWN